MMRQQFENLVLNFDFKQIEMPDTMFYLEWVKLFYLHSFIKFFEVQFAEYQEHKYDSYDNRVKYFLEDIRLKFQNPDFTFGVKKKLTLDDIEHKLRTEEKF